MLAVPKTEAAIQSSFENYIDQISNGHRKWDLTTFANSKLYVDANDNQFKLNIFRTGDKFDFKFVPVVEQQDNENTDVASKRKWWKFW